MPGIVPAVMYYMRFITFWRKGEEKAGWRNGQKGKTEGQTGGWMDRWMNTGWKDR